MAQAKHVSLASPIRHLGFWSHILRVAVQVVDKPNLSSHATQHLLRARIEIHIDRAASEDPVLSGEAGAESGQRCLQQSIKSACFAANHKCVLSQSGDNVNGNYKLRFVSLQQGLDGTHKRPDPKDNVRIDETFHVTLSVQDTGKIQTPHVQQPDTMGWVCLLFKCVKLLLDPLLPPSSASRRF
jgi:hypothetical protein